MSPGLVITGFHRSGTSAVARVLERAGLRLGTNLLGAEPSNPYGHFEDIEIIKAHDAALERDGLTWKHPVQTTRPADVLATNIASFIQARSKSTPSGHVWGVKDPRICLFLDEWLRAKPDLHVVIVIRQPGAAINSLHRRHAQRYVDTRQIDPSDLSFWQNPDLALQLWIHYHEQLLASLAAHAEGVQTQPARVHLVNFDEREAVENLPQTLSGRWALPFHQAAGSLDPELGNRGATPVEVRDSELINSAAAIWGKLLIYGEQA